MGAQAERATLGGDRHEDTVQCATCHCTLTLAEIDADTALWHADTEECDRCHDAEREWAVECYESAREEERRG